MTYQNSLLAPRTTAFCFSNSQSFWNEISEKKDYGNRKIFIANVFILGTN